MILRSPKLRRSDDFKVTSRGADDFAALHSRSRQPMTAPNACLRCLVEPLVFKAQMSSFRVRFSIYCEFTVYPVRLQYKIYSTKQIPYVWLRFGLFPVQQLNLTEYSAPRADVAYS